MEEDLSTAFDGEVRAMHYARFGLVLTLNHACNLRCTYCYAGRKFNAPMPERTARRAIDRATASLRKGGVLELGFFGGEPLLEPRLLCDFIEYAGEQTSRLEQQLFVSLTTNGTVDGPVAWANLTRPDLELSVSHDGLPETHDRHRRFADGSGSSERVLAVIDRLLAAGKDFQVVAVVRPDTVCSFPDGIVFLLDRGVRRIEPSLDLWTRWTRADARNLDATISRCAGIWRDRLPDVSISWFDEKAALLTGRGLPKTARCAFGAGQVAVAPSGRLYPCERLIGEDLESNPAQLLGDVFDGADFLNLKAMPCRSSEACARCTIRSLCNTTCRCSNYVRTGDSRRPDGLLCLLNRACARETARVLDELNSLSPTPICGGL